MLLAGVLFVLFALGLWLYCLTDAILTPAAECRGLPKPAWVTVIALTFIGGGMAWLIARAPARPLAAAGHGQRGRAVPPGPDDDPEFLRALDRAIRGSSQAGEGV